MKLKFEIEVAPNDHIDDVESEIIREAARQLINEVLNNRYEHYGRTFRDKLQEEIKEMLLTIMDTNFKEEVKNGLVEELTKKYVKSKQYKEIQEQFSIDSDAVIKSGMKDIIADLINSELKKKFK